MAAENCIFCKMVAGYVPVNKIYEDDVVLAFLDIGPVSDGHTLVIPKQHFEKAHECPPELLCQIASRLGKVAAAVIAGMNVDSYNILCNNGRSAGQLVEQSAVALQSVAEDQDEGAWVRKRARRALRKIAASVGELGDDDDQEEQDRSADADACAEADACNEADNEAGKESAL